MSHRTSLLLLLLLIPSQAALALAPDQEIHRLRQRTWSTAEGLPQSSVESFAETRDGYLWMGTQEGLVRFDGVNMRVYNRRNTQGLPHNEVTALFESRDHTLWIGTKAGLARLRDETFENLSDRVGVAKTGCNAFAEMPDGVLWVGTDAGLVRVQGGHVRVYTTHDGLPNDTVYRLALDREGTLWAATLGGLARLAGEHITAIRAADGLAEDSANVVLVDHEGTLWVGTRQGLSRLQGGQWTRRVPIGDTTDTDVSSLFEDRDGALWVGTHSRGVYRYAGGRWEQLTAAEGLGDNRVHVIGEDREGSVWIGTAVGGVTQLAHVPFTTLTSRDGLANEDISAVYGDREGALWIGSDGGLHRYRDGRFTVYTERDGLSDNVVRSLYQGRTGDLLVGTNRGLDRLRDGRLLPARTAVDGFPGERVTALTEDHEGTLWVGLESGLAAVQGGTVRRYTKKNGLPSERIGDILDDPGSGALWIGTHAGLVRFQNGRFTTYGAREGLANERVGVVHRSRDGTLWLGTSGGGLARFRDGRFTSFTTREGLYDDVVFQILEDDADNFWISCNVGVYRISRRELEDYAAGRTRTLHCRVFGTSDGLKSTECNGGSTPAGWRSADGRLWFSTVAGLAMVDPARLPRPATPPPVVLADLVADGRHLAPRGDLHLGADNHNVEIHYTAPSFLAPGQMSFCYRLEGFDSEWIEAGTRRVAYYTRIPPGRYRFRVMSLNGDGAWSEEGQTLTLVKQPHYYETWWFRVLVSLTGFLLLYGFYQVRLLQLRRNEARLSALVAERTRKLEEAQERIAGLLESSPKALRNLEEWAQAVAVDLAHSLGAGEISIWVLGREGPKPLVATTLPAPSLEMLREAGRRQGLHQSEGQTVVPARGMTGEMYGLLVVRDGRPRWENAEQRLLLSFAHQLGGALETQRMRLELSDARERWNLVHQEMLAQGIELLRLCPRCGRCYEPTAERCEQDGAPLVDEDLLPYRVIERYRLVRRLGQGGMGIVFEAHDERLERRVAVKIIRAEYFRNAQVRLRFEQEARLLASIRHPGVIDVYDTGELPSGAAFIAMERLVGADLAEVLRRHGRGTPAQVAAVVAQGGAALAAAHAAGFVHRDIKPANIFLEPRSEGLRVRLLDFGLAKSMQLDTSLTQTGMLLGTPLYMSPEQVQGREFDARSDLYSLAVVAYEALVGKKLIEAEEFSAVCVAILQGTPPPPSRGVPGLPPAVDRCFAEALARDREGRPQHVGSWAHALAELLAGVPADIPGWPSTFDGVLDVPIDGTADTLAPLSSQRSATGGATDAWAMPLADTAMADTTTVQGAMAAAAPTPAEDPGRTKA